MIHRDNKPIQVEFCDGKLCSSQAARDLRVGIEDLFSLRAGQSSPNGDIHLEHAECEGDCLISPKVVIDGKIYEGLTKENMLETIKNRLGD